MQYRNAKYINENGWIDCEIDHPEHGWIPYTLDPDDQDMTVDNNQLLARMAANNDVGPYIPPTPEEIYEMEAEAVRLKRDRLLRDEVDPIASNNLRWSEFTEQQKEAVAAYRRALLDVPQQSGFPSDVIWPEKP
jgi:hypothetical protein